MKRCRYILCTLVLLMIMTVLAGCHAEYNFTLKVTEDTETEYMLDILIPISEDSPDYGERSWPVGATQGTGEPDTQPQIALYDSEGYRSMLVHYRRLMAGLSNRGKRTSLSMGCVTIWNCVSGIRPSGLRWWIPRGMCFRFLRSMTFSPASKAI